VVKGVVLHIPRLGQHPVAPIHKPSNRTARKRRSMEAVTNAHLRFHRQTDRQTDRRTHRSDEVRRGEGSKGTRRSAGVPASLFHFRPLGLAKHVDSPLLRVPPLPLPPSPSLNLPNPTPIAQPSPQPTPQTRNAKTMCDDASLG
jgi:hypothetical protein